MSALVNEAARESVYPDFSLFPDPSIRFSVSGVDDAAANKVQTFLREVMNEESVRPAGMAPISDLVFYHMALGQVAPVEVREVCRQRERFDGHTELEWTVAPYGLVCNRFEHHQAVAQSFYIRLYGAMYYSTGVTPEEIARQTIMVVQLTGDMVKKDVRH